jgi:hypothetical protein
MTKISANLLCQEPAKSPKGSRSGLRRAQARTGTRTVTQPSVLQFTTTSNNIVLILLNILLKFSPICSRRSIMYTAKIEARASHPHGPACLHDCETLRKSEALKTLSTELYIVKDLTVRRLLKEGRWQCPDASFDLPADMGWAIRVGSPRSGHSSEKNVIPRICIPRYVWKATASSKSQMAVR